MSAFEISVTPTRLKTAKNRTEAKEPTIVTLAPFSAKPTVVFENVPVTKFARRVLLVTNPSEEELKVMVTRVLSPEYNISLEWTKHIILPNAQVQMEISWNPLTEISCKETLQLTDSRNFKKDISIILKSIKNKTTKNVKRFPNISSSSTLTKTLKLKSPTGTKSPQRKTFKRQSMKMIQPSPRKSEKRTSLGSKNFLKSSYSPIASQIKSKPGKENVSPVTPANASNLFDKLEFTPALEITSKSPSDFDYLASLPTPGNRNQEESILSEKLIRSIRPRRLSVISSPDEVAPQSYSQPQILRSQTPRKRCLPKIVVNSNSPSKNIEFSEKKFEPKMSSTITKKSCLENSEVFESVDEMRRKLYESQINNKTFELKPDDKVDCGNESKEIIILNQTTTLPTAPSRALSVIEEEYRNEDIEESPNKSWQKTFNLDSNENKDLKRDVQLVGTPLKKQFESMNDLSATSSKRQQLAIKGSMPNLNDLEAINHIEQNRYYKQDQQDLDKSDISNTSATSTITVELVFNHHEILAQSSRYNIHEIGSKSARKNPKTPSPSDRYLQNQSPSPKMIKNLQLSPLLGTIDQTNEGKFRRVKNPEQLKRNREDSVGSPTSFLELPISRVCEMSISPPKRSKIDPEQSARSFPKRNVGIQDRTSKWSKTQPKNVKLQKTLTLLKKPVTPCKVKLEPRVMLYDSSSYLQSCINPDPFAATTTCDPFLAATMYLDERSVQKHEIQFKKWLNALVAIPAEFDSDCNQKVDVGRLFNEVRNKEVALAPTKQQQCLNYLTKSRMDSLRRAAIKLFMSEEMRQPCSKVAVLINKQSLRIRSDRNLHLDVVLQRHILELLLNFNPLWLRIGLEVVFGEIVQLNSNSDIVGLSTFILNRLFRDRLLEQKRSRAYSLSEEYGEYIKKFTLQKFLFLLLFLDTAKNKKIMKHNPCLFVKSSQYKETKEILLRFSSELLANVGDISRDLRRVGYVLTHKQSFLDEFDYAFNNLAVDLRDGIRLTRVMEIILLRDDLSKQLRVPAISRLQRIFNVNLALNALAEADFVLTGNIFAADIVDGHREKTLSLLWQVIYKFRAPKFNAAAEVIQNWWRKSWLKVVIKRRIMRKIEMRRNAAATIIQAAFRGYIAKRYVQVYKWELTKAVVCVQKYVRRYIARNRFLKISASVVCIQRWYRNSKKAKEIRIQFLYLKESAIVIQCWFRRQMFARKLEQAAPIIRELKDQAKLRHEKAIIIQKTLKSYVIRKKFRSMVQGIVQFNTKRKIRNQNAAKIQAFFRMYPLRKAFVAKREVAKVIQKHWRSYSLAKAIRFEFLAKRKAAITIQRRVRAWLKMKKDRREYLEIRKAAILVQRRFRSNKLTRQERAQFLKLREVTLKIQRRFRANKAMQVKRSEYIKVKSAILVIQQRFRAQKLMQKERERFLTLRSCVIKIQIKLRATILAKNIRLEFLRVQYHAILVQQRFRANQLMKKDRAEFLRLKASTISIQRRFRANILAKFYRNEFQKLKTSVITIQRRFKGWKAMKEQKQQYISLKRSTIIVQRMFRSKMEMIKIRNQYLHLRSAVIFVQRSYKAKKLMQRDRAYYQNLKCCIIKIQSWYRAHLEGRRIRQNFLDVKAAAITIQRRFRANKLAQQEKLKYSKLREATLNIQQRFRANKAMRNTRSEYLELKSSVILVQQRYRAQVLMRKEIEYFLMLRSSTIKIQIKWRATIKMRRDREQFLAMRESAILIQRVFRSYVLMKNEREEFLRLRAATLFVQQKFRGRRLTAILRQRFISTRRTILGLQQHIRGYLARARFNAMMTPEVRNMIRQKRAAIIIQRCWRGYRVRLKGQKLLKIIRENIIELKKKSQPQNAIKYKISAWVSSLKERYNVQEALTVLVRLENISRTVPHTLMEYNNFIILFCYGIMAQSIRSEADKQIIELCSRIILNLARFDKSNSEGTFQEGGLVTIAQMLLRWCDKDCAIFNTLCTLIWIFSHSPEKKQKIREFMTTPEALFMVRETKKLVLRKEKMKKNARKLNMMSVKQSQNQRMLPSLNPDFGVAKTNPYIFNCSVFAFDTVLASLEINLY